MEKKWFYVVSGTICGSYSSEAEAVEAAKSYVGTNFRGTAIKILVGKYVDEVSAGLPNIAVTSYEPKDEAKTK